MAVDDEGVMQRTDLSLLLLPPGPRDGCWLVHANVVVLAAILIELKEGT